MGNIDTFILDSVIHDPAILIIADRPDIRSLTAVSDRIDRHVYRTASGIAFAAIDIAIIIDTVTSYCC